MTTLVVQGTSESEIPSSLERPRRTFWGAVIAGALVAVALHVMLDLLGLAVGIAVLPVTQTGESGAAPETISLWAAAWWLATTLAAVFFGAFAAGRLSGTGRKDVAALAGLSSWATSTVIWVLASTVLLGGALAGALGALDRSRVFLDRDHAVGYRSDGADRPALRQVTPEEARQAKKAAAGAALVAFFGLLLSAGAGCLGGVEGSHRNRIATAMPRETPSLQT
jgi:hypothetical protein